ncbi:hypothetical protein PHLGIDRAFT_128982 [Phlebiopsis gigantea 11061_1 CR5-6]|uniref:Uncharacterized protein n=1 Tax=Phlebiopsis gigantea (strain 11061_1 CR5-6) TaxID=745531 RepID=A0A0C3S501_PHLG1|nr:hypothetical protein PHLGIDRAFT_128982 [Phlebiopsis gigantea 11061_1 CR5-6]
MPRKQLARRSPRDKGATGAMESSSDSVDEDVSAPEAGHGSAASLDSLMGTIDHLEFVAGAAETRYREMVTANGRLIDEAAELKSALGKATARIKQLEKPVRTVDSRDVSGTRPVNPHVEALSTFGTRGPDSEGVSSPPVHSTLPWDGLPQGRLKDALQNFSETMSDFQELLDEMTHELAICERRDTIFLTSVCEKLNITLPPLVKEHNARPRALRSARASAAMDLDRKMFGRTRVVWKGSCER